ncbi:hypothetical protein ASG37_06985 [Sphingomonas sp. Leaf407]|uniref:autotransporter outer membrane beta-barrel domain-containing protein n=1 Tax=unclassified Sphingomonas TaxID=196159 RepID=UPI0006F8C41F|nr:MULTISPECIES: autotransporter outer membrane beta-barrel domain-containing protein [unclassified Sphingomonas]KQN39323.1 hypothetical protein ASE97_04275 [Sphingomonas sp. Leaf42]KQT28598.1 hypothetical protein ASG37_06985 [Sphingomonas sp. Leaf407]
MISERTVSRAAVAVVLERFMDQFDFAKLTAAERSLARRELVLLRPSLADDDGRLAAALERLDQALGTPGPVRQGHVRSGNATQARRLQRLLRQLAPLTLGGVAAATVGAAPAFAYAAPVLGDSVVNPETGTTETVIELIGDHSVRTDKNNVILLAQAVGDVFTATVPDTSTTPTGTKTVTYTVTAVSLTDGRVTGVTLKDAADVVSTTAVVKPVNYTPPAAGGGQGSATSFTLPRATGERGQFSDIRQGGNGGNGRDGGGVEVCFGALGCARIAYDPKPGGAGAAGPTFVATVDATNGDVTTIANKRPGIAIVSTGGNGGEGGTAYGTIPAAQGGAAGAGGTVRGNNYVDVVTNGENSHGMLVQSTAGRAGSGGGCYIGCTGGGGGTAASGGVASGYNYGDIFTYGKGAAGMVVQSMGGSAGTGGESYGIVGIGGKGGVGGNGGNAYARNEGRIRTAGEAAHGVLAQSVGGVGGNAGAGGGLVAFGGDGGGAGNGGTAEASAGAGSVIVTTGDFAFGVSSQSIGGGGGLGAIAGGIVSFGASGGTAGSGGTAKVSLDDGAYVETSGEGAYGVFAQSVGGMGGTAFGTGGVFTMGGTGGVGGNGGMVDVVSGATIVTGKDGDGTDARGIFAQSVGGGGGNALASGGVVALGGSGGIAGNGQTVRVETTKASSVTTRGLGADGIFAQSVGGGGGAGASSGGVVAMGGSGGGGGIGGAVSVRNAGEIQTWGQLSRGILAQSVGGGGGTGGDGSGLAAIGGSGSKASQGGDVTVGNSGAITTNRNRSHGILAQSIGGGGGEGGTTGIDGDTGFAMLLAIGGSGGGGGSGGIVTVDSSGSIVTRGDDSHGLFAQSVGGGGGNGGSSTSLSLFAGVAIGGSGAGAGDGGTATLNFAQQSIDVGGVATLLDPTITTAGERSRGVFLQSVGGGGGSGGFAVQATGGIIGAVSVALGGSGSGGGDGGEVRGTGDVRIFTAGANSEGFYAQSVGGGGGAGGYSIATAVTPADGAAIAVGIGGSGAGGGDGGFVKLTTGGSIVTQGMFSTGLLAQSVGGGGGNGGYNISSAVAAGSIAALGVAFGMGGTGAGGGAGGDVDVVYDGSIATGNVDGSGSDSAGAVIQSVGGGGGNGGANTSGAIAGGGRVAIGVAIGLGGAGAGGGSGGEVKGTVGGGVVTRGERSTGVLVQSAGGGGGNGGYNISGNLTAAGTLAGGASIGFGGAGGLGGDGGIVTGRSSGTIATYNADSSGLVVQSVGGGGGNGALNVAAGITASAAIGGGFSLGFGGSGGKGGKGGKVEGYADQTVTTQGDNSTGVLVQSTGGGGGAGGLNVAAAVALTGTAGIGIGIGFGGAGGGGGDGGAVTAVGHSVTTAGLKSSGFVAQSVGGAGGTGGINIGAGIAIGVGQSAAVGVGLGGSGGGGGAGGVVDATVIGSVSTKRDMSHAVIAQSVGGGGGVGGFNIAGGLAAGGMGAGAFNFGLGGSGGGGGGAAATTLRVTGEAVTGGKNSDGIVAQSLGGGGGNGAFNVTGGIAAGGTTAVAIGFGVGGAGGGGGAGGTVRLEVNEDATAGDPALVAATTVGDGSRGIVAQSVGGGGGNGGFNVTGGATLSGAGGATIAVGVGGIGGDGAGSGAVVAKVSGRTTTQGAKSDAVIAQSVGGGGGNGAFNISGTLALAGGGDAAVSVGVGGAGGKGGSGESVTLAVNAAAANPATTLIAAATAGEGSRGIVAQSLGGGGGNGGFNVSAAVSLSGGGAGAVSVGIGGSGGDGGDAGKAGAETPGMALRDQDYSVDATIRGRTLTTGVNSDAVVIQSLGGGGGNGDFNVSGALAIGAGGVGGTGSVGIGGSGGKGGQAGAVRLRLNDGADASDAALFAATTQASGSRGVVIQSLGGGGGGGAFNVSGGIAIGSGGAGAASFGIGGSGGGGGDGARIDATVTGRTATAGAGSDALVAQSIGGGGGSGGFNVAAGVALSAGGSGSVAIGIGGSGGGGGDAGAVRLGVNQGVAVPAVTLVAASTERDGSRGIVAQSLGGGGGNGGFNVSGALSGASALGVAVAVGIGGAGGDGGDGKAVDLSVQGMTQTLGADSHGVVAQSVGGGGGSGGFNVAGSIALAGGGSAAIGVGIGGSGGGGGNAGAVDLRLNTGITTNTDVAAAVTGGDRSGGVLAQSIGGGGGTGGFNVTGGLSLAGQGAAAIGIGIGGSGGGGGSGGAVAAAISGRTATSGKASDAVLAQSVGGGGGSGAMNITGGIAIAKQGAGNFGFGMGGSGGRGGDGSTVDLLVNYGIVDPSDGLIAASTQGSESRGIVAQSLGGGGGTGGFNVTGQLNAAGQGAGGLAIGVGGSGGGGGKGDRATLVVQGATLTQGFKSDAVLAQSIGGGGGDGAFNVAGGISLAGKGAGTVAIGVGGSGGDGGAAGAASAIINATVRDSRRDLVAALTSGDQARGVVVQSMGGGGGNGAFNISGIVQIAGTGAGGVAFGVGGSGGKASDGGLATASITGQTITRGAGSDAIVVQSVGGGGGNGGFNVSGALSFAGKGAGAGVMGVGGSGGGGGKGGDAAVRVNSGVIVPGLDLFAANTTGAGSRGIVVQSLGGGGGDGAFNISGQISGAATGAGGLAIGIGGSGGGGGDAGSVIGDITGRTTTAGAGSIGILAQSVGGGGGNGSFNVAGSIALAKSGAGNVTIGVGGSGGSGGDAGSVTLDVNQHSSDPTNALVAAATAGDGSTAIVAQSLGGGGGNGSFNVSAGVAIAKDDAGNLGFGMGGSGGIAGVGGAVKARIHGDIATGGVDAGGALIQSVGGGGGNGGFNVSGGLAATKSGGAGNIMIGVGGFGGAGGNAGTVDATLVSGIVTTGNNAYGAAIQSIGGAGGIGGFNVTGGVSLTMGTSAAGTFGLGFGGFGGGGGDAGNVVARMLGSITTSGAQAHGLLVQSQGGGGGAGGMNITGGVAIGKGGTGNIGIGVGGFGGTGGDAGTVDATTRGSVSTSGAGAYGALFLSLGGAGGVGAMNVTGGVSVSVGDSSSTSVGIGVGGFGGGGGDAKRVTASVDGLYRTDGVGAAGVVATSLGGGGGDGGINVSGTLAISSKGAGTSVAMGVGGFGGDGGTSGDVTLTRTGQTVTQKASSDGVVAQSIGGGGGRGGMNVSGGISGTLDGEGTSVVIGVGGFGGAGGNAGKVDATIRDSVWAAGSDAATPFYPEDLTLADDQVVDFGARTSLRNGSSGIVVKSVGGGGGSGGINISGGIALAPSKGDGNASALVLGIGGFGGAGGDAGDVTATIGAISGPRIQVQGTGDQKSAIYVASIGGGGGDGALNVSGGITTEGQVVAGIGGSGSGGGFGRAVVARVDADLFATGYQSSGLAVQSLGGGGGNGGINISGGLKTLRREPVIVFGMGGDGGVGNSSGDVTAYQHGQVVVNGFNSTGVLAQSIAGGGGNGGMSFVSAISLQGGNSQSDSFTAAIGVGGSGGRGSKAGDVRVESTGDILMNTVVTVDDKNNAVLSAGAEQGMSTGIKAQSIGGGGGNGGFNFVGTVAFKNSPLVVAVGGSGDVGGDAGDVTVIRGLREDGSISRSLINTFGIASTGLVAQSIGGGGGSAATNLSLGFAQTPAERTSFGGLFQVGGDGATSGDAGRVNVVHVGSIQTNGAASEGILAQSIGKGGGNAAVNLGILVVKAAKGAPDSGKSSTINGLAVAVGGAAGDAGTSNTVTVRHDGTIQTKGNSSSAIVAQSMAGGGGNVALNTGAVVGADNLLSIGIGRQGGRGGRAGNVAVTASGLLVVDGNDSNGIVAQSIGGAGGLSGTSVVGGEAKDGSGDTAIKQGFALSVGLEGGAGGLAGTVDVDNRADIVTSGRNARGILAQSIGGDGGVGGSASVLGRGQAQSVSLALGGGGGGGSRGQKVSVRNLGTIVTTGVSGDAIFAQSIGGGGGIAGAAATLRQGEAPAGKTFATVGVTVGGSGGSGAVAGDVQVDNFGQLSTTADDSLGIRAQSIGGGGGSGGAAYMVQKASGTELKSFSLMLGGSGGAGNAAGRVDVANYGLIRTAGEGSHGIGANSIGGGGGNAGSVGNITKIGAGSGDATVVQVAIGGSGGSGGSGGTVRVANVAGATINEGTITTSGAKAHGIFAQSLGGGGGNGSSVLSLLFGSAGADSVSAGLSLGGAGGDGNLGGSVTVENSGRIYTDGVESHGILAQSIGGGGGNGGVTVATNGFWGGATKRAPILALGGIGGTGNDGGTVRVVNTGQIFTTGARADGIVAQSIGGGGGNAGLAVGLTGEVRTLVASNLLALTVGAVGGGGSGKGGEVFVENSGDITVTGAGAKAIVAQSINGGGGGTHFSLADLQLPSVGVAIPGVAIPPLGELDGIPNLVAGEPVNRKVTPVIVATRLGADGVASMNAGKVTVSNTGTVRTAGDYGAGITEISVGSGGGALTIEGNLVKAVVPLAATATASVPGDALARLAAATPETFSAQMIYAIGLGAKNSTDGSGADIVSTQTGDVVTTGAATPGIMVQTIGGGGGSALVNVTTEDATLIDSVRFGLGGVGTSGSSGGAITRTQNGIVATTQALSHGALIQSIGGGGGSAIGRVAMTPASGAAAAVTSTPIAAAIVSLGANGGARNDGGVVDVTFNGGFATQGAQAHGLIVQSIGAGGGSVSLDGLQPTSLIVGGVNGAGGSGGAIRVANTGAVTAQGTGAHGMVVQSIGGGGGIVSGAFARTAATLSAANSGNGGTIAVTQKGDVIAGGDRAFGIVAQSLGGGGGLIGDSFAGSAGGVGSAGALTLDVQGSVMAVGVDSTAIVAQSMGSQGAGDILVTTSGNVRGGSGTGAAIRLAGGANNVVRSAGTLSAVSGLAVVGGAGNDRVVNTGMAIGNFTLGGGTNALENAAGATLVTLDTIDLRDGAGSSGTFTNAGQINLGLSASAYPVDLLAGATQPVRTVADAKTDLLNGTRVISQVALDGDFVQTKTGNTTFDVAFGPYASDRFDMTGRASVNGTAGITLTWLENSAPVLLWAAAGGGVDNGLSIPDTLAIDYRTIADAQGIKLGLTSNFGLSFLTANQQAIGRSLDSALTVGNAAGIGRLMALLGNLGAGQEATYQRIMAELDPEPLLAPGLVQFAAARTFAGHLSGCDALAAGTRCVWGRVERNQYDRNDKAGDSTIAQDDNAHLRAGFELPFAEAWALAGAVGYDDSGRLDVGGGRAHGDWNAVHAGVAVRRAIGGDAQGAVSLGVAGGLQRGDIDRRQTVFVDAVGQSRVRNDYVAFNANAAYTLTAGRVFARPELNLSYVGLGQGEFAEKGLLGLGVQAVRHRDWIATATPGVTLGVKLSDGVQLSANGAAVLHDKSSYAAPFRLLGADASAAPAMIRSGFDRTGWAAGVDLTLVRAERFSVDAGYRAEWGRTTTVQNLRLKAKLGF